MSSYTTYLVETVGTLLGVCVVAWLVLVGARRAGWGRPTGPIELYGRLPLDGRRVIYLVRVGPQVLVVGVGENGFTKLAEVAVTDLPVAPLQQSVVADMVARVVGRGG